jgi:hypothetical protein
MMPAGCSQQPALHIVAVNPCEDTPVVATYRGVTLDLSARHTNDAVACPYSLGAQDVGRNLRVLREDPGAQTLTVDTPEWGPVLYDIQRAHE